MTDHPILFSAPMMRALWDGRKTQTRRILKTQPEIPSLFRGILTDENIALFNPIHGAPIRNCQQIKVPYAPGDRLWVREAHWAWGHWELTGGKTKTGKPKWRFVRDWSKPVRFDPPQTPPPERAHLGWHPRLGRFMFRQDSRMTLPVIGVRVQQLQDISEDDAIAEGISLYEDRNVAVAPPNGMDGFASAHCTGWSWDEPTAIEAVSDTPKWAFQKLWESINGPDAWNQNPWCSAYSFEVIKKNIDQIEVRK